MKRLLFWVVALLLLCFMSYWLGTRVSVDRCDGVVSDTETYVDTVVYRMPVARDSAVVRYVRVVRRDSGYSWDSCYRDYSDYSVDSGYSVDSVVLPITQKVYSGEDYCAYVSGYLPCLDSICVYPREMVVRERAYKPPNRWHIGIMTGVGYGILSRKAEPYVGVGITYSIISF